eukprot:jgi/Ulvmu1/667/UM010_0038.1
MRLACVLAALVALLLHRCLALSLPGGDHDLPGWSGEGHFQEESAVIQLGKEDWHGEMLQLAWSPRLYLLKGFLTGNECDHLISLAQPFMARSEVADDETGESFDSEVRTSTGMFLDTAQDDTVAAIEKRVAQVTMIPEENQEAMQILHYHSGQEYQPHHDFFGDSYNVGKGTGGQRAATVLMYLTTPEEGGETVFPEAERSVEGLEWSECARQGLAVKAVRGDAVMFFSLRPDGSEDDASLHGSCATTRGDKWSATKWIRIGEIGAWEEEEEEEGQPDKGQSAEQSDPACVDRDRDCQEWADTGECQSNMPYMRSYCPKACKLC